MVYVRICNYFKSMVKENISQEFRLKNISETKNYFIGETNQDEFISASEITECISIPAFVSLVDIPIDPTSSAVGLKICVITA